MECPICLETTSRRFSRFVKLKKCKHVFHKKCIKMVDNNRCPMCREYINDKYTFLLLKKNRILMRFMQLSIKDKYLVYSGLKIKYSDIIKISRTSREIYFTNNEGKLFGMHTFSESNTAEIFTRLIKKLKENRLNQPRPSSESEPNIESPEES